MNKYLYARIPKLNKQELEALGIMECIVEQLGEESRLSAALSTVLGAAIDERLDELNALTLPWVQRRIREIRAKNN